MFKASLQSGSLAPVGRVTGDCCADRSGPRHRLIVRIVIHRRNGQVGGRSDDRRLDSGGLTAGGNEGQNLEGRGHAERGCPVAAKDPEYVCRFGSRLAA